jgi:MFS family permease
MIALLRRRNFALLWTGGLISQMGDWALFIALPMYVYRLTGSPLATSGAFIAELIPSLLLGSMAGVFVDRWNRRHTALAANLLQAVVLLPLLVVHSADLVWVVYAVGFCLSIVTQFLTPAENALLPAIVPEEDLVTANSLVSVSRNGARLVGPALGGAGAALGGLTVPTLIDVASFLLAALMLALVTGVGRVERAAPTAETAAWKSLWNELRQGLDLIRQDRLLTVMILSQTMTTLGEGVFGVMFVVWVRRMLDGGALQLGWFMSAQAVGGLLGGLVIGHLGKRLPPLPLLSVTSIAFGLLDIALFSYPLFTVSIWPGLVLIVVVGIPAVAMGASWNTLVQTRVADAYRGRVFGVVGTGAGVGLLAGTLIGGLLGGIAGPVLLLNVFQGGSYIVAGLAVAILLRHAWRAAIGKSVEQRETPERYAES